ncbi:MAG: BON domain-containing protein [Pirellulales bacterium]|nr:BON domain-containing protein [Pirellulales bacterium]
MIVSESECVNTRLDKAPENILEDVQRCFIAAGYSPIRRVDVSYLDGSIVLCGRVPTYYQKQIAQALAMAVPAVGQVVNLIEVMCQTGLPRSP